MEVKVGKRYRHYKGNTYVVLAIGLHEETHEKMVVYEGEYDDPQFGNKPVWVRPYSTFIEHVEIGGKRIPRFNQIGQ